MNVQHKVEPCLWFNYNADEAVALYATLFKDTRVIDRIPGPDGKTIMLSFELAGRRYWALNGGPQYKFTEAISMFASCDSQAEIDRLWDGLIAGGGAPVQCGWLKDKFGLSWQIVPGKLMTMLTDPDHERSTRVMQAVWQMVKLDLATLEKVYAGR